MRKILVILLVVGLLIGTSCVVEDLKKNSDGEEICFDGDYPDTIGDPIPCGGSEGGGSGGGLPG